MEADEEAGLRAFALNAGSNGSTNELVRPAWIEVEGQRVAVVAIDADWREDERFGFRVSLSDGSTWLLYYVPALALWSGVADKGTNGR